MSGMTTSLLGWVALSPVLAPIPPTPPPNPHGRAAIGVRAESATCVISEVFPGMPAAKAGVRVQDRIIRIGSAHPTDFSQVITQISAYRPGAVVEIEVERDGERKVFKMALVPRPPEYDSGYPGGPLPLLPDD
jgi:S1-C subfamily serine protease